MKKTFMWVTLVILSLAAVVYAAGEYSTSVYMKVGGDELVVSSGGTLTVEAGGTLANAGTATFTGVISGGSPFVLEGATANAYETTLAVTDPTADRTITIPNGTGALVLSTMSTNNPQDANSVWMGTNEIVFEGATADAHEAHITAAEQTGDVIFTIPVLAAGTYAFMGSTLATNGPDVANSVYGASNGLVFEGVTANTYETTIAPADPCADRTVTLPDASGTVMLSSLATNAPDVANGVWGASNGVVFEGATADACEITVTPTDPTADRTLTLPDATGTVFISTLSSNAPDAANGVWAATGGIMFEGSSADGNETTLTLDDPNADRTITLPDYTGSLPIVIAQGNVQTSQAGAGVSDVTGTSITLADNWFTAGKTLKWTIGGTKTGANNALKIALYVGDANDMTLTSWTADANDWEASFTLREYTDTAHQGIIGSLLMNGEPVVTDYAAGTHDMAAGAVTIKARVTSQNAGDTVTTEYTRLEYWNK